MRRASQKVMLVQRASQNGMLVQFDRRRRQPPTKGHCCSGIYFHWSCHLQASQRCLQMKVSSKCGIKGIIKSSVATKVRFTASLIYLMDFGLVDSIPLSFFSI
jgi:hypothetical protein